MNTAAKYAMMAIELLVEHKGSLKVKFIIEKYRVDSPAYLKQIMKRLVAVDVLSSKRGASGGYGLARSPDKINLLEVIEAVSPIQSQMDICARDRTYLKIEAVHKRAITEAKKVLKDTKLSDLL